MNQYPSIAFLTYDYALGGVSTFIQMLASRLPNTIGLGVTHKCTSDPDKLGMPIKPIDELIATADIIIPWWIFGLKTHLKNYKPKVINTHHGAWSNQRSNMILINQFHITDAIVCVNADVAKNLRCITHIPIFHIPYGIDTDRLIPTKKAALLREQWNIKSTDKVILFGHRLDHGKRPLLVVDIAKALPSDHIIVIAGDGTLADECYTAVQHLSNARFVGVADSLADWLSQSDCFLSLSVEEGFGLSVGEAVLASVPVVSPPVGIAAINNIAYTIPAQATADAWATLIKHVINTDTTNHVSAAKAYGQEHWSIKQFISKWEEVLYNY